MRVLFAMVVTVVSLIIAVLPEAGLYFLWKLVNPQTDLARVLLGLGFLFGGGGICILFGFVACVIWVGGIKAALDA